METRYKSPLSSLADIYPGTLETALSSTHFYFHRKNPGSQSSSSITHRSHNHTASMSIALNPDAPSFIPFRRNTIPSATPVISPDQNPNTYLSYYPYPFYLQLHQTQHGTSVSADLPPQYFSYQYISFPRYYTTLQLVSTPCAPALPPSDPRCSIQELEENLATKKSTSYDEMIVPKPMASTEVVTCRRTQAPMSELSMMRAPHCRVPRRRSSVKVSHRKYEIREDADFEMGGKTTLMIKNIPGKFRLVLSSVCCHFLVFSVSKFRCTVRVCWFLFEFWTG